MKPITVLVADDHTVVREGFRSLLSLEKDILVVGEASDGRTAVTMAGTLMPDVVLMDIAMPQLNGIEATRQLVRQHPGIRVLILSAHSDDAYLTSAMESGAKGFLLKQTSSQDVCRAIRAIKGGKTCFSPSVSKRLDVHRRSSLDRPTPQDAALPRLTPREREVLQLVAEGKANKQTAAELGIGTKTVEKHREHLMAKLDIHDTAGLTRYAISAGIIESSVQVTIV